jgi:very-short-patch-repair endonuclease
MAFNFLSKWAKLYNGTPAEMALEPAIAALGRPYRFQHPLWSLGIFPDFVLLNERLVIEVDDKSHNRADKRKADALRTKKLNSLGWRVVRCTNEEALQAPFATVNRLMEDANLPYRVKPPE